MLRLTGGEFRGRSIQAPEGDRTRPTQAKLRQALFNSIQMLVPDARVLDLFSGSGSLAFEALSRGAELAVAVETAKPALKLIAKNADTLGVKDRLVIIDQAVEKCWEALKQHAPFHVVLADPPYVGGWETRLLNELPWGELLAEDGLFCLEWGLQKSRADSLPDELPFLVKVREKTYGDSVLTTFRRKEVKS